LYDIASGVNGNKSQPIFVKYVKNLLNDGSHRYSWYFNDGNGLDGLVQDIKGLIKKANPEYW